jgi:deoxyadenosine/deoxycytidine kinase
MTHTFITGGIGSGKTYLANSLHSLTGVKVVSLDAIFFDMDSPVHRREKEAVLREEELLHSLESKVSIFEGWHFGDWLIPLYRAISLVIIVDTPLEIRKERIKARFKRRKAGIEIDPFPKGGKDHLENLLKWTNMFDADKAEIEIRKYCHCDCRFLRDDGYGVVLNSFAQVGRSS